jgi:hypothetical protein
MPVVFLKQTHLAPRVKDVSAFSTNGEKFLSSRGKFMPKYKNKFYLIKYIVDFPFSEPEYNLVDSYVRHNNNSLCYQHLLKLQTRLHKLITSKIYMAQFSHSRHVFLMQKWFNTDDCRR